MIDPIVVQSRLAHVGDIRTGTRSDKGYPTKLDTFRITTPHEAITDELAGLYGGTPTPWEDGYELITTVNSLPVRVHTQDFDPFLEVWSKGGLQKRCTGTTEYSTDYPPKKVGPCPGTTPDNRRDCTYGCKPTTRISVILDDATIVGSFTARTTSFNANREITQAMTLIAQQWRSGVMFPQAFLELRQETRVSKGQTTKFGVLTLRPILTTSIRELMNTPQPLHPSGRPILPQDQPPLPDDQILEPPAQRAETPPPPGGESADVSALLPDTADTPPALPDDNGAGETSNTSPAVVGDTGRIVALAQLHNHTTNPPTHNDTKPTIETWIRTAFQHAHNAQLPKWQTHDGPDALHLALQKLGYDHLGELRKPQLLEFAQRTHTALTDTLGQTE